MNNTIRIFHSQYSVTGKSVHSTSRNDYRAGQCTCVCRRVTDNSIDVAVSFCHKNETFKKKEGVKIALRHMEEGNYITIPVSKNVTGKQLNDVIRSFLSRDHKEDYRHLTFGTTPNLPVKDWNYVSFSRRVHPDSFSYFL